MNRSTVMDHLEHDVGLVDKKDRRHNSATLFFGQEASHQRRKCFSHDILTSIIFFLRRRDSDKFFDKSLTTKTNWCSRWRMNVYSLSWSPFLRSMKVLSLLWHELKDFQWKRFRNGLRASIPAEEADSLFQYFGLMWNNDVLLQAGNLFSWTATKYSKVLKLFS